MFVAFPIWRRYRLIYTFNARSHIKFIPDSIVDKFDEFKGMAIAGIITQEQLYCQNKEKDDPMGIGFFIAAI